MTLNDCRTPSCEWLTVDTTFYFHPTVQNGNAWFGRGGMWECKPFDEAGDTLHTRSVISPGERKLFLLWVFSLYVVQWLRFWWPSVSYKMLLFIVLYQSTKYRYGIVVRTWICQIFNVNTGRKRMWPFNERCREPEWLGCQSSEIRRSQDLEARIISW